MYTICDSISSAIPLVIMTLLYQVECGFGSHRAFCNSKKYFKTILLTKQIFQCSSVLDFHSTESFLGFPDQLLRDFHKDHDLPAVFLSQQRFYALACVAFYISLEISDRMLTSRLCCLRGPRGPNNTTAVISQAERPPPSGRRVLLTSGPTAWHKYFLFHSKSERNKLILIFSKKNLEGCSSGTKTYNSLSYGENKAWDSRNV